MSSKDMSSLAQPHIPVMLNEVLAALQPAAGDTYVDGTFGAGGYTSAILDMADCTVVAIDRDPNAFATANKLVAHKYGARLKPVHGSFSDVTSHLQSLGIDGVDGLVVDLGVSSMQIDDGARGFSFNKDGPLDMRMNTSEGETAADLVRDLDETDLADIIYRYGEERHARRIAGAIVRARAAKPITTTLELAEIVRGAVPGGGAKYGIHPATRTFQALRIAVNSELEEVERVLDASIDVLKAGARLVVVSFHSLEDSIVKAFLKKHTGGSETVSRHMPERPNTAPVYFSQQVRKSLQATDTETKENPRARSAKLRWAIRTSTRKAA